VPVVSSPIDRSRTPTRETRPASRCAPDTAASTAPHPASVTIAIRPSGGVGWREFVEMICPTGEAKYFCNEDWTTKIYAQRPRWEIRSIQPGGGNGIGLRMLEQLQRVGRIGAEGVIRLLGVGERRITIRPTGSTSIVPCIGPQAPTMSK
jgi:hypothetical protein